MADIREQIELFALGRLSGNDLEAFEARLAADPDFAAEVAREVELIQAIRLAPGVDALRSQLEIIEKEAGERAETANKKPGRAISFRLLFAAAAAVMLCVAAIWFFNRTPSMTAQELFAAHFQPPATMSAQVTGRGAEDTTQTPDTPFFSLLEAAEQDYNKGNPAGALEKIARLQALPESSGFSDRLAFYAGLGCLQTGKPEQAIREFEKIREDYPSEKPWYLALARLNAGQTAEAKADFQQISGSKSPFAREAAVIFEHLK
jgi:tetratricopeptide (TPR) repeat protein